MPVRSAVIAAGRDGGTAIYFALAQFDPYAAGLPYISSDPQSQGLTGSDGQTKAQSSE